MWFRRDLRTDDNAALYHALKAYGQVYCAFVFDTEILDALTERADRRVEFIWQSLQELEARLREYGGALIVRHGPAREEIVRLAGEHAVDGIVMGTRGMNALGGLLLGSVAQRVVHLATVPVTLCR